VLFLQNDKVHAVLIFGGCLSRSRKFNKSFVKFIELTDVKSTWGLTKAILYVRSTGAELGVLDSKLVSMTAFEETDAMHYWENAAKSGGEHQFGFVGFTRPSVRNAIFASK
jgi:hypothetical protein